ncbi:hypothetical protein D3C87_1224200 [compost metagenome]
MKSLNAVLDDVNEGLFELGGIPFDLKQRWNINGNTPALKISHWHQNPLNVNELIQYIQNGVLPGLRLRKGKKVGDNTGSTIKLFQSHVQVNLVLRLLLLGQKLEETTCNLKRISNLMGHGSGKLTDDLHFL